MTCPEPRPIQCISDWTEIARWAAAIGEAPPSQRFLPPTGLIIEGVCAGWLYKTDGALAAADAFIFAPEATPELLETGFAMLMAMLEAEACSGARVLIAYTPEPRLQLLLERLGYQQRAAAPSMVKAL